MRRGTPNHENIDRWVGESEIGVDVPIDLGGAVLIDDPGKPLDPRLTAMAEFFVSGIQRAVQACRQLPGAHYEALHDDEELLRSQVEGQLDTPEIDRVPRASLQGVQWDERPGMIYLSRPYRIINPAGRLVEAAT
jgi:hypothetical protein